MVKDTWPGSGSSMGNPTVLARWDGKLWFRAFRPDTGHELYRSNGKRVGTKLVRDINPGPDGSAPYSLTVAGDSLFFAATRSGSGRELWRSKGGAYLAKDIRPGAGDSDPFRLTRVGKRLYFIADGGSGHGIELWMWKP